MQPVTVKICGEFVQMIWLDGALLRLDHLRLMLTAPYRRQPEIPPDQHNPNPPR